MVTRPLTGGWEERIKASAVLKSSADRAAMKGSAHEGRMTWLLVMVGRTGRNDGKVGSVPAFCGF